MNCLFYDSMTERVHPIGDQGISKNTIKSAWLRDELLNI